MPVDRAITYLNAMLGAYTIPQDMVLVWAEEMGKNAEWVASLVDDPVESKICSPEFSGWYGKCDRKNTGHFNNDNCFEWDISLLLFNH